VRLLFFFFFFFFFKNATFSLVMIISLLLPKGESKGLFFRKVPYVIKKKI
jgi:hypothetical protein